ncbi:MAG: hypothetical protein ACPHX7_01520 [Candidatus Puniceispirillaceae bacterium]
MKRKSWKFLNKYSTLLQIRDVEYSLIPGSTQALKPMVLPITATHSITLSFLYVILFCIGTLMGMGLLTIVVCQRARHYFSNLFSAITACLCLWTGGTIAFSMSCKAGRLFNIVLLFNHHPE